MNKYIHPWEAMIGVFNLIAYWSSMATYDTRHDKDSFLKSLEKYLVILRNTALNSRPSTHDFDAVNYKAKGHDTSHSRVTNFT